MKAKTLKILLIIGIVCESALILWSLFEIFTVIIALIVATVEDAKIIFNGSSLILNTVITMLCIVPLIANIFLLKYVLKNSDELNKAAIEKQELKRKTRKEKIQKRIEKMSQNLDELNN